MPRPRSRAGTGRRAGLGGDEAQGRPRRGSGAWRPRCERRVRRRIFLGTGTNTVSRHEPLLGRVRARQVSHRHDLVYSEAVSMGVVREAALPSGRVAHRRSRLRPAATELLCDVGMGEREGAAPSVDLGGVRVVAAWHERVGRAFRRVHQRLQQSEGRRANRRPRVAAVVVERRFVPDSCERADLWCKPRGERRDPVSPLGPLVLPIGNLGDGQKEDQQHAEDAREPGPPSALFEAGLNEWPHLTRFVERTRSESW